RVFHVTGVQTCALPIFEGLPYQVVGVVGAGSEFPRAVEVWVPASDAVTGRSSPQRERLAWAGSSSGAIGRRAPGAALPVVQEQRSAERRVGKGGVASGV